MEANSNKHEGRPSEYRGPLTPGEIAAGMNAATRNARRLAADARLLLDAGRLPTAAALATLSIEETGKVSILREIAVVTSPGALKKAWKRYRDHRSKNGAWILPDLIRQRARRLGDLGVVVNRDGEHTSILNSLKQIGLYTDCYGRAHWSEPSLIFEGNEAKLAHFLVDVAGLLAHDKDASTREIELWVEHMRPVWQTPDMPSGLLRFADVMFREGLTTTSPNEYARFLFGECEVSDYEDQKPLER
jgi:AbiV family abortive infection protein